MNRDTEQLIHDVLHGNASSRDRQRLSDWITAGEANAKAYLRIAMDERAIQANLERAEAKSVEQLADSPDDSNAGAVLAELAQFEARAEQAPIHIDSSGPLTRKAYVSALSYVIKHTFTPKRIAIMATAAVLLIGVVLTIVFLSDKTDYAPPIVEVPGSVDKTIGVQPIVATLTSEYDAQWGGTPPLDVGVGLQAGQRLTLTQGFAEITTKHGAVAILEAPASIELLDHPNAIQLNWGKLVGLCNTEPSKGFLVRTEHADIVDIGTEFGVEIDSGGALFAHVFQGEVEVVVPRPDQRSTSKQLSAGQGAVVTLGGIIRDEPAVATTFVRHEEFEIRRDASISPYHRWLAQRHALRQDPDTVLYFDFEGVSDDRVMNKAQAASPRSGTIIGAEPSNGRFGQQSEGLAFDGEGAVALDLPEPYSAVTIAGWFYIEKQKNWMSVLLNSDDWRPPGGVHWQLNNSNTIAVEKRAAGNEESDFKITTAPLGFEPQAGRWVHLAVVMDTGTLESHLYVDGRLAEQGALSDAEPIRIGAAQIGNWNNVAGLVTGHRERGFVGRIDELAVLKRAVSAKEIEAMHQDQWRGAAAAR